MVQVRGGKSHGLGWRWGTGGSSGGTNTGRSGKESFDSFIEEDPTPLDLPNGVAG